MLFPFAFSSILPSSDFISVGVSWVFLNRIHTHSLVTAAGGLFTSRTEYESDKHIPGKHPTHSF